MKFVRAWPLCLSLAIACASITGTQMFEASGEYSLPAVDGSVPASTITAVAAENMPSFAASLLEDIDGLRENSYVDSADVSLRIVSAQLSTDTTFSGVKALRLQLVTGSEVVELCNRTLTVADEQASTIRCDIDYSMVAAELERTANSATPAQVSIQLDVAGEVTAQKLTSNVAFEVKVDADVSL